MRRWVITAAVLWGLGAGQGWAQDEPDPEPDAESVETPAPAEPADPFEELERLEEGATVRPLDRPIELMTRDELAEAGFEFGASSSGKDTSGALLLSLTAGVLVHGIGHLHLGDLRTGWFLVGLEAASLGLLASSGIFAALTSGASPWSAAFAPALQAGLAGFAFSFLADVVGTLTRDEENLPPNTGLDRGIGFRARYVYFGAVGAPVRHALDGRLLADVGWLYGNVATTQDVLLDLSSYRGRLGVRPLRGADPLTFLAVETNADYLQWQATGEFGRVALDGRLVASYQFGRGVPHLSEMAMGLTAGLGNHWIHLPPQGSTKFELATTRLFVPFDAWASLNVSQNLNVRGGYGAPELDLLAARRRLLGVAHLELIYRSSAYGDISLKAEMGDGLVLWLGGGLWIGG